MQIGINRLISVIVHLQHAHMDVAICYYFKAEKQ